MSVGICSEIFSWIANAYRMHTRLWNYIRISSRPKITLLLCSWKQACVKIPLTVRNFVVLILHQFIINNIGKQKFLFSINKPLLPIMIYSLNFTISNLIISSMNEHLTNRRNYLFSLILREIAFTYQIG